MSGIASADYGAGVYGYAVAGGTGRLAGFFNGTVSKTGGTFLIDHPDDPANRYLRHSFVESPDRKNIYDGIGTADENGEVVVQMPAYFESLNMEYRYLLTAIGAPAPDLFVKTELTNSRFTIAGARPGLKVSWQVTGIRKDAWAVANPVVVDEEKRPEDRGYFLHPEVHGEPIEKSIHARSF